MPEEARKASLGQQSVIQPGIISFRIECVRNRYIHSLIFTVLDSFMAALYYCCCSFVNSTNISQLCGMPPGSFSCFGDCVETYEK